MSRMRNVVHQAALLAGGLLLLAPGGLRAAPAAPEASPVATAIGPCNGLHRNVAGMATVFATPGATAVAKVPVLDEYAPVGSPPAAAAPDAGHAHAAPASGTPAVPAPDHVSDRASDHAPASAPEPMGTPRLLAPESPAGTPAAEGVVAGMRQTMLRYLACANAGDAIGLISLVSDDFLRQSFGNQPMTEADLRAYADTSQPLPLAERRRLVGMREPREIGPGQFMALVDTAPIGNDDPAAVRTDLVTFVPDNYGNYLIDQFTSNVTLWFGPDVELAP